MRADLEILARELKHIAETGRMPDGALVRTSTMTWAEGWLLSLAELGIMPAAKPPVAS
jgi:hypothetical protein